MQKTLSDLDKLQAFITLRWADYKQAIKDNKSFEEVKTIYMQIRELEKQADELMQKANNLHSGTVRFSKPPDDSGFVVQ
ncbi:MAG TPA: hypothetical protein VEV83_08065 [Parafilimonas sp.]|nr:hypothetical protein [Parafilimonas sp.]